MNISSISNNTTFKGYDVMPLRGLYMQGWENFRNQKITDEMLAIAKKEQLPLYINNCGQISRDAKISAPKIFENFYVWAQDTKHFLCNGGFKNLMCSLRESVIKKENLGELNDFNIKDRKYLPRGGNFYIGLKPNGDKWMLISSKTITGELESMYNGDYTEQDLLKGLYNANELVKKSELSNIYGVKPEDIHILNSAYDDLDMLIRPIGYPYVLVNDCKEVSKNMAGLKEKNPNIEKDISSSKKHFKRHKEDSVADELADSLKELGFIPIKIGGAYFNNVNFLNAIAFRTKNGGISYITNSTRDSVPGMEDLEKLFEKDLRAKVDNIENVYFVSGGNAKKNGFPFADSSDVNSIMYWLGELNGGIHCMTSEIPDFNKILSKKISQ